MAEIAASRHDAVMTSLPHNGGLPLVVAWLQKQYLLYI
jgi:hypothetical protein